MKTEKTLYRIGRLIEKKRKEMKITSTLLAEKAKVNRVTIYNIECGQNTKFENIVRIFDFLKIDWDELDKKG